MPMVSLISVKQLYKRFQEDRENDVKMTNAFDAPSHKHPWKTWKKREKWLIKIPESQLGKLLIILGYTLDHVVTFSPLFVV